MAEISVDTGGMRAQEGQLQSVISCLEKVESEMDSVNNKIAQYLSSQAYQNIRRKISQASGRVAQNKRFMQSLKNVLSGSRELYQNTESKVEAYFGKSSRVNWSQTGGIANVSSIIASSITWGGSINGILKVIENLPDNARENDILEKIKTILGVADKWGNKKEAGIIKKVVSYVEDFINFCTGDKKGITGASDWCSLADSSIGMWGKTYEYFSKKYGVETGFFGKAAQRNVKIAGLTGDMLGLLGSVFLASTDFDQKKWQSIVADYVDCGKDMITVIKSGYELKHMNDVKSLAKIKSGPWSALDIYTAIGDAAVRTISQGFKSHEKYYADGKWDLEDTAATGIDISLAGIYGFSHKLTLGLDDWFFGIIDKISGGNGTDDMSYIEKAAEGYKIAGASIGNWIAGLIK